MKEIFVESRTELVRAAIREDGVLKECIIEEKNNKPISGEIYKGVIKNIVPAIKCAFVDIGYDKNCYMHVDAKKDVKLKKGEEVLIEVIKEELGDKGPKVTNRVTIAGRNVIIKATETSMNFSKKIQSKEFMDKVSLEIEKPDSIGVTIRTNAEMEPIEIINKEIQYLYSKFEKIQNDFTYSNKIGLLHSDRLMIDKLLRDYVDIDTKLILVDDEEDFEYINHYIKQSTNKMPEVKLYKENTTMFYEYEIEKEILNLRNPRVNLNCGGYIIIEKTEAMYVIDVNSGKNIKGNSIHETGYTTNMEAAKEICRQIRLRNLNGIILIDFIDIKDIKSRKSILKELKKGFEDDKNKTVIYPFTELNLVQIARRRKGKAIYEYLEEECDQCLGAGKRIKLSYLNIMIKNEVAKIKYENEIKHVYIQLNSTYEKYVRNDIISFISEIDALDMVVYLNFNNVEKYKVEPLLFNNQRRNLERYKIYG